MHTRAASWLWHRLGRAVVLAYALALLRPGRPAPAAGAGPRLSMITRRTG
ncbi:hypothetical protein ACFWBB_16615 [Streptomyces sp. NPDC060000]